jgi:hypothetical protein
MAAIKDKVRNCGHHHSPYRLRGAVTSILQGGSEPQPRGERDPLAE